MKSEYKKEYQEYQELKTKYPDVVILMRHAASSGYFYTLYEQDAREAADILGLTLTKNSKDGIETAGFPLHALDIYLPKLIRAGRRVAICEQIEGQK